jgi:hypothetical protein
MKNNPRLKRLSLSLFVASLIFPLNSFGGTAVLEQSPLTNSTSTASYSTSNFTVCGSQNRTFLITYNFSPHKSCWNDRYKYTFKLYKDGNLLLSTPGYLSSSSGQKQYIFGLGGTLNVTPGVYTAQAVLQRRPCAGAWYNAETITTNSITASSTATPNFSINGTAATDGPNNVPSIVCNAGTITANASNTTCEASYWVGVWETTQNWWERTFDYEWGGWFQGQAPNNINLQNLATTSSQRWISGPNSRKDNILMGGVITGATTPSFIGKERYYTISVCTAEPTWTCKIMQIRVTW